jgi:hypothetical protein
MATARGEVELCPLGHLWRADRVRTGWISDGLGGADMSEHVPAKGPDSMDFEQVTTTNNAVSASTDLGFIEAESWFAAIAVESETFN